jgi:hypothetical protein
MRRPKVSGPAHRKGGAGARKIVATGERDRRSSKPDDSTTQAKNRDALMRAELIGSDICTVLNVSVRGHAPVLRLCRLLVDVGHDPTLPLDAWRGPVLCLRVRSTYSIDVATGSIAT